MDQAEVQSFLVGFSIIAISLALTVVVLFLAFIRRKNKLLVEQSRAREAFEKELSETQIEIREETLRNISWELHDNIGQLITLAKIQVQMLGPSTPEIQTAAETLGKAVQELRALSKLINPEALNSLSLREAVQLEVDRFNRMQFVKASLEVQGEVKAMDSKEEIIIFRMLQEFFSNTIKHSKATELKVALDYGNDRLEVDAQDNGVGFETQDDFSGIGLRNMRNRAKLVGAHLDISSGKNEGTRLHMVYNYDND